MPVEILLPTVLLEAGSKLQFVTFCDLLYQFYEAEVDVSPV